MIVTKEAVLNCPNGCYIEELEIGKESESFHALIDLPFQYIRCGKCKFNDDGIKSNDIADAIAEWNAAVLYVTIGEGNPSVASAIYGINRRTDSKR